MLHTLNRRHLLKQAAVLLAGSNLVFAKKAIAYEPLGNQINKVPIRLTSNENPYGPSPLARKAMAEAINTSNRYPFDVTIKLKEKIASRHDITKEQVLLGAGSSQLLGLITQLAALQRGNAITADPAFSIWIPAAEKIGLKILKVPLTTDKKHDMKKMLSHLNSETRLFYICNPNNPTGTIIPTEQIKWAIEEVSKKGIVLLDEAYLEYSDEPSLSNLTAINENLVVVKTFSKIYGLAGARIGYALAHPDTIKQLAELQRWSNACVSAVSLGAAIASLQDDLFISDSKKWNRTANDFTEQSLKTLGLNMIPSFTNFLYYSVLPFKGDWQKELRNKNILTGGIEEQEGKWTRTTIGTMEEMKTFISVVTSII